MKHFLVQITQYGFATIEAESHEDAEDKAEQMPAKEFDMSKDVDVEVLTECDMHEHSYGLRVRWGDPEMATFAKDGVGTIVPQPIGSTGKPPPGGCYVLWDALKEPMACFLDDLVECD